MSFPIKCDCCGELLAEPGALYFGVPNRAALSKAPGTVRKKHICVVCVPKFEELFR